MAMPDAKRRGAGFTLIEITIVIAILGILLSFAIPNFLRNRMTVGEMAAIAACRTIFSGCQSFYGSMAPRAYPQTLVDLTNSDPPFIDPVLGSGSKQGYRFLYTRVDTESFELRAEPVNPGWTGNRFFYIDQGGIIRANVSSPAGVSDPPV